MSSAAVVAAPSAGLDAVRLPVHQIASNYDVALVPDLSAFTFQGHVLMTLELTLTTQTIVLNAADLTFPNDDITGQPRVSVRQLPADEGAQPSVSLPCVAVTLDAEAQRVTFAFGLPLQPGTYELSVNYRGVLNDQLAGFYRSAYKDASGSTKHMAVTQFEATDARRALPCIDEPAAKARFDVTLLVSPSLTAVSNMPVLQKTTTAASGDEPTAVSRGLTYPANLSRYQYYTSPIMSTYLLAVVVGEFDYISKTSRSGTEVRVYTGLGKSHLGRFSLDTAVAALDFYNEYFGIPYPLPKMDLLAIPDFAAGAMENWGCITYRETALLIDSANSSAAVMQRVARTVSHEIAHMWFGNLVTMEWWSYLWLNEGFARFMEHLAVDAIYPHWRIWESFVAEVFAQAQNLDALHSSHPVEVPVHHPNEVNEIFDTISYAKGASLIRMLNAAIGDDAFRDGLRIYLNKFAFKNTQTSDLWDALSETSGTDVAKMMDAWVTKIGYPVVKVSESKNGPQRLCFCQERFLATYDEATVTTAPGSDTLWTIPIEVASWKKAQLSAAADPLADPAAAEPHTMKVLLNQREVDVPALGWAADSVLKVNPGSTGFYRVQYSDAVFDSIAPSIPLLPSVERLGLLRDAFAMGSSGRSPMRQALGLLRHFEREENYAVVSALAGNLAALLSLHREQAHHAQLQSLVRRLFAHNFARLGWECPAGAKEDQTVALFRALVVSMMNSGGDAAVQSEALRRFRAFVADPAKAPVAADLRGTVYAVAAKKGTDDDRAALLRLYRQSELQEEKNRILAVLGLVEVGSGGGGGGEADAAALERVRTALRFLLSDEVRPGNVAFLMAGIGQSAVGRAEAWAWFQQNFATIQERFCKGQNFTISNLLNGMLGGWSSKEFVAEFEAFFAKNPIPQAKRALQQLSESITTKAARLEREKGDVAAWLASQQ